MYVTGALAQKANLNHINISIHHKRKYREYSVEIIKRNANIFLLAHIPSPKKMLDIWQSAKNVP